MSENNQEPLEDQKKILSRSEIISNFMVLQNTLYGLCRDKSNSDHEFEIKFEVYERLMKAYKRWGNGGQLAALTTVITICLKGTKPQYKLLSGVLYVYWTNHFYTLSSYIGIISNLPWALRKMQISPDYELGQQVQILIQQIKLRDQQILDHQPYLKDSQIEELVYQHKSGKKLQKTKSYVSNNYFEENRDQYIGSQKNHEEELQLPFLDSFLSRYIYHSFKRWGIRSGQWMNIISE